jgi:hypothetical protein
MKITFRWKIIDWYTSNNEYNQFIPQVSIMLGNTRTHIALSASLGVYVKNYVSNHRRRKISLSQAKPRSQHEYQATCDNMSIQQTNY